MHSLLLAATLSVARHPLAHAEETMMTALLETIGSVAILASLATHISSWWHRLRAR